MPYPPVLTPDQVTEIRSIYVKRGGIPMRQLAEQYGCSIYAIWKAVNPERAKQQQDAHREKCRLALDLDIEPAIVPD